MAQVLGLAELVSVLATPRKMIILLYAFRWNCTLARLLAQDNADGPSRALLVIILKSAAVGLFKKWKPMNKCRKRMVKRWIWEFWGVMI